MLKSTPLREVHVKAGATLTPFGGWEMPLRYRSELTEHHAVRTKAGLFDLSHMGEFLVRGKGAADWLNNILSNDVRKLSPGKAHYTFMLNPAGGIIDDLIIYQLEEDLFMLVVNAATTDKDWKWLQSHLPAQEVTLQNISDDTVLLALSGPESETILRRLTDAPIQDMAYYTCLKGRVEDIPDVLIATTGYTGEWTYELFVRKAHGEKLWNAIISASEAVPAGLAARNTLRLEMGYLLYGTDVDEETSPLEASAAWAVKLDKGDFIGRAALLKQKENGLSRKLFGLVSDSARVIPRNNTPLLNADGQEVGRITSGSIGPTVERGVALGYLPSAYQVGDKVYFTLRGQQMPLTVTRPPFVSDTSLIRRQKSRI
ncbi:MAG: glycine cleavage system aminomethyltransferase GcvT [Bacteroidia bacterium]|nr:glycine cleavage system aminomethyltransferase GcvT [Bacteroidia bacterium]MCX7652612.1 glycine cleavage system aminomethyltransferase GcvT [Bacteroidia bacterium]MDW8417035.1 glycine cleavage system aminomethyltransferase GcvT [Bacteroidia bacterium]